MVPNPANRIRVIVVDDHPVALAGIRVGLKRFHDIDLECEALDGTTALQKIAELRPDVAVIDVNLPDIDGLEVTARVRELSPKTRIILTSGDLSISTMSRASQLGVAGFFHKSGAVERLALVIRSATSDDFEESDPPNFAATAANSESFAESERDSSVVLVNGSSVTQVVDEASRWRTGWNQR